ncbi:uncharacterized protein UHOD_12131 [Ustilago sp. UG-2017b]|nr:uncharacterized protein UHOD_12131 [Ustilago sp. UG-2017b]
MQLRKAAYRAGINRRIALRKPFLTSKNRHKHLEWAKANGSTDWRGVLFTDEAAVEAAICKQRRAEYNIQTQEHLQASPDLNPIENIWHVFKNLLGKRLTVPKTRDELARAAEEVWNTQITLEHINPVIDSMEHRVEQVLTKQGGPLKY